MKTLKKLLTAVCVLSLTACTVYETTPTNPPPPAPVVYEQAPAPAPAPAPQPVYQQPAPAPAPTYNTVNGATQPAEQYQQPAPAPTYNTVNGATQPAPQPVIVNNTQPITVQGFYDELAPYGQWVNYGSYGYVWIPAAGADFVPYSTAGHWVYTDYGWTWASDYRWGWATFHYGRWEYDAYYGWMWIPDTQWGPAWVSWRHCDGYYGWAPLGYGYGWNNYNDYNPPANRWVFVNQQYITSPTIYNYYEPRERYNDYYNRSQRVGESHYDNDSHVNYIAGPNQGEVTRLTGMPVTTTRLTPASGPGASTVNNGGLTMYRPAVQQAPANNNSPRPAPRMVTDIKTVPPVQSRPVMTRPEPVQQQPAQQHMGGNMQMQPAQQPQQRMGEPAQQQQGQMQQHAEPVQQPAQQPQQRMGEPAQQQQGQMQQHVEPAQQPAQQHTEPAMQQQPAQQRTEPSHMEPPPAAQPQHQAQPQQQSAQQQQPAQQQKGQGQMNNTKPAKQNNKPQPKSAKPVEEKK
jgi:hypothetical protein